MSWEIDYANGAPKKNNLRRLLHSANRRHYGQKMRINSLLLWLAFPGYAVYHVARPFVQPNSGFGLFGITMLAALLVSGVAWLYQLTTSGRVVSKNGMVLSLLHWVLIAWMSCVVIVNVVLGVVSPAHAVISVQVIVAMAGMYCLGVNFKPPRDAGLFLILSLFFAGVCTYYYVPSLGYVEIPPGPGEAVDVAYAVTSNYQGIARSIMYTGLLAVPFIRDRRVKSVVFLVYCWLLVKTGSRTDAALMVLLLPAFVYINYGPVKTALFAAGGFALVALFSLGADFTGDTRYSLTGASASLEERTRYLMAGLRAIHDYPLIGDFMYYLEKFDSPGAYIHNGLSMWADYGLFAMALYVVLILATTVMGVWAALPRRRTGTPELLLYLGVTSLVGVVVAKSIAWPMPALAWGIAYSFLSRHQVLRSRSPVLTGAASPTL